MMSSYRVVIPSFSASTARRLSSSPLMPERSSAGIAAPFVVGVADVPAPASVPGRSADRERSAHAYHWYSSFGSKPTIGPGFPQQYSRKVEVSSYTESAIVPAGTWYRSSMQVLSQPLQPFTVSASGGSFEESLKS